MSKNTFSNKIVIVTGAGRGLGLGMARHFGQAGAHVVIAEINPETGSTAAETLRGEGLSATYEPLDVREPAQSTALVEKLVKEHGRIDIWINNAGVAHQGRAETMSPEQWEESIAVMLSGAFYCAQAAGRQMLAQGQGVIVNVAAVDAYQPIEGWLAVSVPKAGLVMLTEALGIEWAKHGVRVAGIAPGVIMTGITQKSLAEGTALLETYERRTPMHRLGTVEEIAEAVLFLAGDEASYIVAETMRVDGGWAAYQLF